MPFQTATFALGAARLDGMPRDARPEVALVGRSNVGKSSLLNALTGRKQLARTSGTPGKTREANFYLVGDRFYLVDLPGLGYAKVSQGERDRFARLIEQYVTERATLRLTLHLVDCRHDPGALDRAVFGALAASPAPSLVVLTKADKLSRAQLGRSEKTIRAAMAAEGLRADLIATSSAKGGGLDALRTRILEATHFGEAA